MLARIIVILILIYNVYWDSRSISNCAGNSKGTLDERKPSKGKHLRREEA